MRGKGDAAFDKYSLSIKIYRVSAWPPWLLEYQVTRNVDSPLKRRRRFAASIVNV